MAPNRMYFILYHIVFPCLLQRQHFAVVKGLFSEIFIVHIQQKFGIRSCHLILLNLGDLERYIADLQQNTPYTKANENYLKAQMLAPKNGKSYNQLAIVAVKSKKKLDAIFYYIRSLEASNPIESSRERLTGIFHEIKRKVR